jgi:cysteinyl-tRNA synthetase
MDDDFNIAPALAAVFQFASQVNRIMDRQGLAQKDKERIKEYLDGINSVVGVMDLAPARPDKGVEELIIKREEARRIKDWETADRIRRELEEKMGIEVIDTKDGTIWRKPVP